MSLTPSNRQVHIDALRGAALFFILLSNVPYADMPERPNVVLQQTDSWLHTLWSILVSRKFLTIFSMLFGYGIYVLMEGGGRKGGAGRKYMLIRMAALFGMGTIHGLLFWYGDILRTYALGGAIMLFMVHWPAKRLAVTGLLLAVLATGIIFIGNAALGWQTYHYDVRLAAEHPVAVNFGRYLIINGTIDPWNNMMQDLPITISFTLGNILLGYVMGRTGFFRSPDTSGWLTRRRTRLFLILGLAGSTVFYLVNRGIIELSTPLIWLPFVIIICMLMQSLAYISMFFRLVRNKLHSRWVQAFAAVGRMSLTNYLMQTFCYHAIFFHALSPLALYGKIGLTETHALCVLLFLLQILFSQWWLHRFRLGPAEWLWRKLLPAAGR